MIWPVALVFQSIVTPISISAAFIARKAVRLLPSLKQRPCAMTTAYAAARSTMSPAMP